MNTDNREFEANTATWDESTGYPNHYVIHPSYPFVNYADVVNGERKDPK